mmetsp:Transcript_36052/g.93626  ORF Transcript_36052/g.93626 Transcript_36052/m.93626 type:complete len:241 (+) Transcript_36052:1458-2180(+)
MGGVPCLGPGADNSCAVRRVAGSWLGYIGRLLLADALLPGGKCDTGISRGQHRRRCSSSGRGFSCSQSRSRCQRRSVWPVLSRWRCCCWNVSIWRRPHRHILPSCWRGYVGCFRGAGTLRRVRGVFAQKGRAPLCHGRGGGAVDCRRCLCSAVRTSIGQELQGTDGRLGAIWFSGRRRASRPCVRCWGGEHILPLEALVQARISQDFIQAQHLCVAQAHTPTIGHCHTSTTLLAVRRPDR